MQASFTGKELDEESGLQYFGARYYDNESGRWASIDPYSFQLDKLANYLADPQSFNSYLYTRGNPVILIDPDGNEWQLGYASNWVGRTAKEVDTAFTTIGKQSPFLSSLYSYQYGGEGSWVGDVQSLAISRDDQGNINVENSDVAVGLALDFYGGTVAKGLADDLAKQAGKVSQYVDDIDDLIPPARQNHILSGDATGGGHRYGANKGKLEFPESWSDKQILHNGLDVATDPSLKWTLQKHGSYIVNGVRDNINVSAVIDKTKSFIKTIFPIN